MAEAVARTLGPLAEARLVAAMWQARRLRRRRDWDASAERQRASLAGIAAELGCGAIAGCAPVRHATGGFFSGVAETEAGPRFVKGVLTGGREARFWAAWERGAIRAQGEHYRLLPPERIVRGRVATVLAFPFLPDLATRREDRRRAFRENALASARALASFNASHRDPVPGLCDAAVGRPPRPPSARLLEQRLQVEPALAEELAAEARAVEAAWRPVRDAVEAGPRCLGHMDLGIGNVVFGDGPALLLDFGHAGAAPVGADLHAVLRGLEGAGPGPDALADAYAAAFRSAGGAIEPETVRRAFEAYYAARYRNLGYFTARHAGSYRKALRVSRRLIAAAGSDGGG